MPHLLLELLIWILLAYLLGCCIGCIARKLFGAEAEPAYAGAAPVRGAAMPRAAAIPMPDKAPAVPPPPPVAALPAHQTKLLEAEPPARGGGKERPKGLAGARGGKADDLQRIVGIGPVYERTLNNLGFYHFDQIAAWNLDQTDWVDDHLKFEGRIEREEWVAQAKLLALGDETEFNRLYGSGGSRLAKIKGAPAAALASTVPAVAGKAKPASLSGPRTSGADDLKRIVGIGPEYEKTLNRLGYYHFDQIAGWNLANTDWVDDHLKFEGRIEREEWVAQAKLLAAGRDGEFQALYGSKAKQERPTGLPKPRGGKPDNLQRISGVGPKNEKVLHSLGFFHFDQIAEWTPEQVDWVDDHLKFGGRIKREEWIRQARLLAEGKEAEFLKQYGTGGLKDKDGETKSGTKTRKT